MESLIDIEDFPGRSVLIEMSILNTNMNTAILETNCLKLFS
jgi:hypothetical protein